MGSNIFRNLSAGDKNRKVLLIIKIKVTTNHCTSCMPPSIVSGHYAQRNNVHGLVCLYPSVNNGLPVMGYQSFTSVNSLTCIFYIYIYIKKTLTIYFR
jgi:hypothetical protein